MEYRGERSNYVRGLTAVAFVFAELASSASPHSTAPKPHMPPGAFLSGPAPNSSTLLKEIEASPAVMLRYTRLYRLSPEMVRAAFSRLRLTRLQSDQIVRVYYVHNGERIGYKVRRIPKGTLVFALPNGIPILAQICGNPLRNTPLHPADISFRSDIPVFNPEEPLTTTSNQNGASDLPPIVRPFRSGAQTADDFTLEPDLPTSGQVPATPATIPPQGLAQAAMETITQITTNQPPVPPGSTGHVVSSPGAESGVDIPIVTFPGGDNGGGTGGLPLDGPPTGGGGDNPENPPTVTVITPEANSLALLVAGLAPLVFICRRRR